MVAAMKIEYVHASKYGNGAKVAAEFEKQMAAKGAEVNVHHVREVSAKALPPADLYVFSSPGRMGRPLGAMGGWCSQPHRRQGAGLRLHARHHPTARRFIRSR